MDQKVERKAEDKGNQGRKGRSRRPRKGKWKTMPFDGNATCKGCKKSGHTWETCFVRQRAIEEFQRNPIVKLLASQVRIATNLERVNSKQKTNRSTWTQWDRFDTFKPRDPGKNKTVLN